MIKEPLFQQNIFPTIFRNFDFYLFGQPWYIYLAAVGILMYAAYRLVCRGNCTLYPNLFPAPVAGFDHKNRSQTAALAFMFLTLLFYAAVMFSLDNTLFNNYDLMSLNTIFIFHKGVAAPYGPARMCPISFFDLNYLYAITHNFTVVGIYILAKQVLLLWLLYRFLDFMPVTRRLFTISIIQMVPAVFWLNNIIFPEQNILIFIFASFLYLKTFSQTGQRSALWWFSIYTLLAIFSKETTVLFYGGILAVAVLYDIYQEKINLSNLLHPWRLAHNLPLETMLFLCCLCFAVFYLFIMVELHENVYLIFRTYDYPRLFNLYKFEITITVLAWLIMVKKVLRREHFANPLFDEGCLFASTFLLATLIFKLHIAPDLEHVAFKSYYAVLPAIFSLIYIARNLHSPKWLLIVFSGVAVYSAIANYNIRQHENGHYYHEAADFLSSAINSENKLSLMLSLNSEDSDWVRENWGASLTYYHPGTDITLKMPTTADDNSINRFSLHLYAKYKKYLPTIKGETIPLPGDFYVIKKGRAEKDYATIANLPHQLVFENKLFKIYKINNELTTD